MVAVSVLMSAVRVDAQLPVAIQSILAQSFSDLEFIIVDDSGTGAVASKLGAYRDPRIKLIVNDVNLGLTESLVRGIASCDGTYIARMDADDIAHPDRLSRQVQVMEIDPAVGLVGTNVTLIDDAEGIIGRIAYPQTDIEIRWRLLLANPFAHPTVMFRRALVAAGVTYDVSYATAQDFALWQRMLDVTKGANIPDELLKYRVGSASVTHIKRKVQLDNHDRIVFGELHARFPELKITREEASMLRHVFVGGEYDGNARLDVASLCQRYGALLAAFCRRHTGSRGLWNIRRRAALAAFSALRAEGLFNVRNALTRCMPLLWR
jgi:glycosyltransferase involved in cell wall biosynthesis